MSFRVSLFFLVFSKNCHVGTSFGMFYRCLDEHIFGYRAQTSFGSYHSKHAYRSQDAGHSSIHPRPWSTAQGFHGVPPFRPSAFRIKMTKSMDDPSPKCRDKASCLQCTLRRTQSVLRQHTIQKLWQCNPIPGQSCHAADESLLNKTKFSVHCELVKRTWLQHLTFKHI